MRSKINPNEHTKTLAELAAPLLKSHLFTHIYAEAGSLKTGAAAVHFDHLPGGKNIFDLASLTKALVTAPLVVWTSEKRELKLSDPVGKWTKLDLVPALRDLITIEQLLMHRSGLPAWRNFYVKCFEDGPQSDLSRIDKIVKVLNSCSSDVTPNPTDRYSDVGYLLLTAILEEIWGLRIDLLWQKFIADALKPSKIADLGYTMAGETLRLCVPSGYCPVRQRELIGEVHDENAWSLSGVAGHAGLFGTGPGLVNYLKSFANSAFGKHYYFAPLPLAVPSEPGLTAPAGYRVWSEETGAHFGQRRAVGHWGFTGTGFWIDLANSSYGVLLTNRVISGRLPGPEIRQFRIDCYKVFADALGKKTK